MTNMELASQLRLKHVYTVREVDKFCCQVPRAQPIRGEGGMSERYPTYRQLVSFSLKVMSLNSILVFMPLLGFRVSGHHQLWLL
jgi:hypothetical protein